MNKAPYSNVKKVHGRCSVNAIDVQELLKNEIYSQGPETDTNFKFGLVTPSSSKDVTPTIPLSANVGFEDYEFHFDSLDRDSASDLVNGEMRWSINQLNNSQDVKNIVEMRVGEFFFPRLLVSNGPDYYFYRRVYMQVLNLPSTQAVMGANGNQYHFEFEVESLNSVAVKLRPLKDAFFFQKPVTSLTDLQVRFMIPHGFKKIPLPNDRVTITSVANTNPARFTITNETTAILGSVGVPAAPGIAAYINGFNAIGNANINNAVNAINGVYITNIVDSKTFEIAGIDFTGIGVLPAQMVIPKNHIAFPLRFTSVKDQLTNYITVGHE